MSCYVVRMEEDLLWNPKRLASLTYGEESVLWTPELEFWFAFWASWIKDAVFAKHKVRLCNMAAGEKRGQLNYYTLLFSRLYYSQNRPLLELITDDPELTLRVWKRYVDATPPPERGKICKRSSYVSNSHISNMATEEQAAQAMGVKRLED